MPQMTLLQVTPEKLIEFPVTKDLNPSATVTLSNPNLTAVAFKIKTTAPKNYCVKPSQGIILSQQSQNVEIELSHDLKIFDNVDRFLIQATAAPKNNLVCKEFWGNVDKSALQDHRLAVVFRKPADEQPIESGFAKDVFGQNQYLMGHPPTPRDSHLLGASATADEEEELNLDQQEDNGEIPAKKTRFKRQTDNEQYQHLLHYSLNVERQRTDLQKELETLRNQSSHSSHKLSRTSFMTTSVQMWKVILFTIFTIMVSRYFSGQKC